MVAKNTKIFVLVMAVPTMLYMGDGLRRFYKFLAPVRNHFPAQVQQQQQLFIDSTGREIPADRKCDQCFGGEHRLYPAPHPDYQDESIRKPPNELRLRYLRKDDAYVFIDENGRQTIPKVFKRAREFSEGLAAVCNVKFSGQSRDSRTTLSFGPSPWNYIKKDGTLAFERQFARVSEFHCGRAIVCTLERPWNPICINSKGETVFDNPEFTEIYPFSSDGVAMVSTGWPAQVSGLVDLNGNWLVRDLRMINFSEGLGAFRDRTSGRVGYIDRSGKVIIPPQFFQGSKFSEGLAAVAIGDTAPRVYEYSTCAKYTYAYIDKTGKQLHVLPRTFKLPLRYAGDFLHGRANVSGDSASQSFVRN